MIMEDSKLLIVDDEENFRNAIVRRLKKRGQAVIEADCAESALSIMANDSIDVVVSDIKMPGMDGLRFLKQIKSRYPACEVILITGHASATDGVSGIKEGAFDYLTKPIALDHLINKINHAREKINRKIAEEKDAIFKESIRQKMIATERLASLGTLSAGVAHEINNPLAIINEACGWMKTILASDKMKDIPRKNDLDKALSKIENSIVRVRNITHHLLQFSRKPDNIISDVNINQLINETIQFLNKEMTSKNIQILVKNKTNAIVIGSDPAQIRQVLLNVMTNAIHASYPDETIEICISNQNKGIYLDIKDKGEGIPPENLDKVFEPFFTTKAPGEGTGLGLFVIKGIIENLKGKISLTSQLGQGSQCSIFFPCLYQKE
jgi:signal transduction histidine kinase